MWGWGRITLSLIILLLISGDMYIDAYVVSSTKPAPGNQENTTELIIARRTGERYLGDYV